MKKLLLLFALTISFGAISQTTVYSEDFTSGSTWTLNTVLGAEGTYPNAWYISCQEDGQPAGQCGTACSIGDNSLHVSANALLGDLGAAYFEGLGTNTNRRAESGNINTTGESNLTLSFDMIGAGNTQDYTELFYSIDGGSSWTSLDVYLTSLCCGGVACTGTIQGLWQTNTYSLPATCENITNLRIAFVWKNSDDGSATDPSFAVDDVTITSSGGASNAIATTNDFMPMSWCYGATTSGTVNFVSTGTYNASNIYTAELSDAAGSFAAPTAIGTLASSSSGNLSITVAIPGSTPVGAGYRIRVVADDPATVGTDNGADIEIFDLPTVTFSTLADMCVYNAAITLTEGAPGGGTYSGPGVSGGTFDPATATLGTHTLTYTYTDMNGCQNSANQTVLVDACASIGSIESNAIKLFPNPASESFQLNGAGVISSITIIDLNGRELKKFETNQDSYSVRDLSIGVYIVKVKSNKGESSLRLVVN